MKVALGRTAKESWFVSRVLTSWPIQVFGRLYVLTSWPVQVFGRLRTSGCLSGMRYSHWTPCEIRRVETSILKHGIGGWNQWVFWKCEKTNTFRMEVDYLWYIGWILVVSILHSTVKFSSYSLKFIRPPSWAILKISENPPAWMTPHVTIAIWPKIIELDW